MNTIKKALVTSCIALFASLVLVGCGDTDNSLNDVVVDPTPDPVPDPIPDPDPDPDPDPVTTSFAVSVSLPAGSTVVQNDRFDPVGWLFNKAVAVDEAVTGLDLSNFEVRLYDADGVNFTLVEIDTFEDNGDGTYFISAVGEPRIDCILVSVIQVDGDAVELQIPATSEGSQEEPLVINYASTAATTQYIESVVESGGFSEELSIEEVDELVAEVAAQVASVVLPDDVDASDPNAVIAALEAAAADLVDAQIEIATAPEPEEGSLAAFAGTYNAGIFGKAAFGDFAGTFLETDFFFEDYSLSENEQGELVLLPGFVLTVDEAEKTAALTSSSLVETYFGSVLSGADLFLQREAGQEAISESSLIPADILSSGKLIVDPGTGLVDEGFIFVDPNEATTYYFAEINNSTSFDLLPWGDAYVGSALLRFDEYRLNSDDDLNNECLNALGLIESELAADEEEFDELLATIPNAASILVSDCSYNAFGHEVLGLTLAKRGEGMATADLAGSWGIIGIDTGLGARGAFSSILTIDANGNMDESDYVELYAYYLNASITVEADTENVTGASVSLSEDGIVTLDFSGGDLDDDDIDTGYLSSDLGLMYVGAAETCQDCSSVGTADGEAYTLFGIPLASDVTAADLDGLSFDIVGLSMSLEGQLVSGDGTLSGNADSNAGITIDFALDGESLTATLGGSSDLAIVDTSFSGGSASSYSIEIELNDAAEGEFPVEIASNGAFTVEIRGEAETDEDLLISGFFGANGRLLLSVMSGNAGMLDAVDMALESEEGYGFVEGLDFINFGYMLGVQAD